MRPVEFDIIAENIGVAWRTIQSAVKCLVARGLLVVSRGNDMQEYGFAVPNCRKFTTDGKPKPDLSKYHKREPKPTAVNFLEDDDDLSPGTVEFIDEDDDAELS